MRQAGAFAALWLSLAGCLAPGDGVLGLNAGAVTSEAPQRQVSLKGGQVIAAGPPGYCVDPKSVRRGASSHFALLAGCGSLTEGAVSVAEPLVMTALVLPRSAQAEQPSADELAASVAEMRVLEKIDGDGVSIVHLANGGTRGIPGGDPRHWRAAMLINGHVTGLALYAPKGSPVAGKAGRAMMIDFAEAMREASMTAGN